MPEALGRAYPDVVRQFATCGPSPGYEGGPGYRGVPPASHYIPPGLLLTPSLVGRRSADSVRTLRGVNGNAARGLVEGWSRCALLLGPPPSREAPAAEEEQRWGWTSTCSVLSVIVRLKSRSEPRGPPLTLALLAHRPRRRCLAPLHRERCWGCWHAIVARPRACLHQSVGSGDCVVAACCTTLDGHGRSPGPGRSTRTGLQRVLPR